MHRQPGHSKDATGCTYSDQVAHSICTRRRAHYTSACIRYPRTHPMGACIIEYPGTLDVLICTVNACTLFFVRTWPLSGCALGMHVSYLHQMTVPISSST